MNPLRRRRKKITQRGKGEEGGGGGGGGYVTWLKFSFTVCLKRQKVELGLTLPTTMF